MSACISIIAEEGHPAAVARAFMGFAEARDFRASLITEPLEGERERHQEALKTSDVVIYFLASKLGVTELNLREILLKHNNAKFAVFGEAPDVVQELAGSSLFFSGETPATPEAFEQWLTNMWHKLEEAGFSSKFPNTLKVIPQESLKGNEGDRCGFHRVKVVANRLLTSADYERPAHCLKLDISDTGLSFALGDHIVIYPANEDCMVEKAAILLGEDLDRAILLKQSDGSDMPQESGMSTGAMTVRSLLKHFLDIQGRASRKFLCTMSMMASDAEESRCLAELAFNMRPASPYSRASRGVYSYLTVLGQYRSVRLSLEQFVSVVPLLRPRMYSAASSPLVNPTHIECSFVVVKYPTKDGEFRGLSTTYLASREPGDELIMSLEPLAVPMELEGQNLIYVGVALGSGVALLRGVAQHFAQAKKLQMANYGKMLLYYGTRHEHKDFVFGDELREYEKSGVLEMHTAFSHDQAEFITPALRIQQNPEPIVSALVDHFDTTKFIYCGPSGPAWESVEKAVVTAIETLRPELNGKAWITKLRNANKWVVQAYIPDPDPENPFS